LTRIQQEIGDKITRENAGAGGVVRLFAFYLAVAKRTRTAISTTSVSRNGITRLIVETDQKRPMIMPIPTRKRPTVISIKARFRKIAALDWWKYG
tara:strand:- start:296 stop:580 length:285 start_codon:yes stop_codon:yes gene_type:complete